MKFLFTGIFLLILFLSCNCQFSYVDILQGEEKMEIPFEYEEGFIIVKVKLDRVLPLNFIFDTGAENTVLLERTYAELLNLPMKEKVNIIGADQSQVNIGMISRRVPLILEKGGPFTLDLVVLQNQHIDFNNIIGRNIDGILGGNMLIGAVVEINYKRGIITFYNTNSFKKPSRYKKFDIKIKKQRPFITANIMVNDTTPPLPTTLLMDTGAGLHFLLDEATHPSLTMPDTITDGRIGEGLGGQLGGFLGNVQSLKILNDDYVNLPVYFQRTDSLVSSFGVNPKKRNGIVGNLYWDRKNVIIDYARNKLYLKNNYRKKKPFRFNKSGMVVFAVGSELKEYIVKHVSKGSVAYEAGVREGDLITNFQGIPYGLISLSFISHRLSGKEGKKIRLTVRRKGEKHKIQFRLKNKRMARDEIGSF